VPLLVLPLAPEETQLLTLAEWDAISSCSRVLFERPDHPLRARLTSAGVEAGPFDDEPGATKEGWALVTDPGSERAVELAKQGATVLLGTRSLDALTAARGARIARRAGASLTELAIVMARLRSPEGCPWDREQSHESLRVHLIEEAHEVLEAIEAGTLGQELEEELGDLLLQVFFHAQLAADDGRFDVADVADAIVAKLIHRHPHVFGETQVADASEVIRNWEAIKAEEKQRSDRFADIPKGLPALLTAYKTQKRAAGAGFEADEEHALERARALLAGSPDAEALGDLLFWTVALARARGIDPEGALRSSLVRFRESLPS
jgi:MazG family protein